MKEAKTILIETLRERSSSNPSYSLRAFARDLGISPQQLSNVIKGRRGLGPLTAQKVVKKLPLSEIEREMFVESLKANFSRSETQKSIARGKLKSLKTHAKTKDLQIDLFKVVGHWHHFALVELIKISRNKNQSSASFARKLGLPTEEVEAALKRLENVGLLHREGGRWVASQDSMIADFAIPSEAIRSYHRQILEKGREALAFQGPEERYGSSSTLPFKVKDLEKARKLIQEFRLAFTAELSDAADAEEVYGLSIQFFRLTEHDTKETL